MARRKKNSGKDPSFQFYWKDWRGETRLDLVSDAARGIWIDLIVASCDMPTPGVFWLANRALTPRELLQLCHNKASTNDEERSKKSVTNDEERSKKSVESGYRSCRLRELIRNEIIKQFPGDSEFPHAFYVKRIYEDMRLRRVRREAGLRGGNPNLLNQNTANSETLLKQNGNIVTNQKGGSSSSSSIPLYPLKQRLTKLRWLTPAQINHCLTCLRCNKRPSTHAYRDSTDQPYGLCEVCCPEPKNPIA